MYKNASLVIDMDGLVTAVVESANLRKMSQNLRDIESRPKLGKGRERNTYCEIPISSEARPAGPQATAQEEKEEEASGGNLARG